MRRPRRESRGTAHACTGVRVRVRVRVRARARVRVRVTVEDPGGVMIIQMKKKVRARFRPEP